MKKITTFLLLFFCIEAHAQITPQEQQNIINLQNQIIQRQTQIENEEIRQKELRQVEKARTDLSPEELEEFEELEAEAGKVVQNYRRIQCFHVDKINFSKADLIPKELQYRILRENTNRCLNLEQIAQIAQDITDSLILQGYVTSRAEIPPQSLYSGALNVNIIESHLEDILFNEEKFFDKTQKFTAFGFYETGQILNIKPIELGLEQVNRLSSNNAVIKILPGKNKNDSIILVENKPNNRTHINFSYDNFGNDRTGERRETIGFAQDNLLWLNDSFSIQRTANDLDETRKKDGGNNSFVTSWSLPFSLYNLNFLYSKSSYFFWSGNVQRFKSTGQTATRSASIDRTFLKDKHFKTASGISFTSRDNQNFIEDVKIESSSRKASIISAYMAQSFFLEDATIFLKPSYSRGINVLDAKKDSSTTSRNSPHSEFDAFRFYGNYVQKFAVAKQQFSYNLAFDSQFARQHLYGIDQFSVGGIYSVRGFKNGTISGDSGYNLRNEISFSLGQFFPNSKLPLQHFSLTPFYDYGYVVNKGINSSGRLSGAGARFGFNYKDLKATMTISRSINKSHLLQESHYKDDMAIFFNVGSGLSF